MQDQTIPSLWKLAAQLPPSLAESGMKSWQRINDSADRQTLTALTPSQEAETRRRIAVSDYLTEVFAARPDYLIECWQRDVINKPDYQQLLADKLTNVSTEAELLSVLRLFRNQEMSHIVWLDIGGELDVRQVVARVSALAEAAILGALNWWHSYLQAEWGTPVDDDGVPQQLYVLGMGKLGGGELNVSSDIDLIFAYPDQGKTINGRRTVANEQYFTKLGQKLVSSLNARTADGFVFRVDMRLRPYGDSGRLASNFDAFQEYYFRVGREWERYALIKAKVLNPPDEQSARLEKIIRSFVYRRYVDFSAVESLRQMKGLINREVRRKGLKNNVKLGPGGIREIEFIGQVFQLIRGGQVDELQTRSLIRLLDELRSQDFLPDIVVDELLGAYWFLRKAEHAIQEIRDEQTQALPTAELDQLRIAAMLGFEDWSDFVIALEGHRAKVHHHFHQLIASPDDEIEEDKNLQAIMGLWQSEHWDEEEALGLFECLGCQAPSNLVEAVTHIKDRLHHKPVGERGALCLAKLIPVLLKQLAPEDNAAQTFLRIGQVLETIALRTAYIELLLENQTAQKQLIRLCTASPWIADQLSHYPILLDELLDTERLYHPPNQVELKQELREHLLRIEPSDTERFLDALRQFKWAHTLRVAASDLVGTLPIMKVSDQLTYLAEALLDVAYRQAWRELTEKFGLPDGVEGASAEVAKGFAIIAYGKLGGLELGYGSDLDLVFLHAGSSQGMTSGPRSIPNHTFFIRLGQKIIQIMGVRTLTGVLYEIDTRLRPSGSSGLLVTHLEGFRKYQLEQAWTWEHQAIVRARFVAGDEALIDDFLAIRQDVLQRQRDKSQLGREVQDMRQKMMDNLGSKSKDEFHLKQDRGGMADLEFIVQYHVLAYAAEHPALLEYTDNIRILDAIGEAGLLGVDEVLVLQNAYRHYRNHGHRLALQNQSSTVDAEKFMDERAVVEAVWNNVFSH